MFLCYTWPRERYARWAYIALLALIIVSLEGQMVRLSIPVDAPRYLQTMASAIQPKLPISVDSHTVLEAVVAIEDTIYYSYKAIDNVRTDFDSASFANTVKSSRLPAICRAMSDLLEGGANFAFMYDDKDGHRIGAFSIDWGDCHK